jgi:hypothetical protein
LLYPKTGFNSCNGHVKGDQISLWKSYPNILL